MGRFLAATAFATLFVAGGLAHAAPAAPTPPAPTPAAPNPAAPKEPARHEPTAGDMGTARNALREGLALRENGDNESALARLQTAFDLVPTPITGFELAKTHLLLGHVLSAHELFLKVVRMPLSLEESPHSAAARDESAKLAKDLEPRIPTLHVKLTLPPGATAVLKIDDEEIPKPPPEMTRLVDPGPHEVSAKAGDGPEQTVHVEVAESETKDVVLTPQWIPPKPVPVTGPGGQVIYVQQTNPLTFVGFGFAAAGLLVSGISTFVFLGARSDAEARCGKTYCPPATGLALPKNAIADVQYDGIRTRYNLSLGFMVAGAITTVLFGGIGAFAAVRPIKEKVTASTGPRLLPVLSPENSGVVGIF